MHAPRLLRLNNPLWGAPRSTAIAQTRHRYRETNVAQYHHGPWSPLRQALGSTAAQLAAAAQAKRIDVTLDVPSEDVYVTADESSLGRLLLILLDNALKYTEAGGRLSIILTRQAESACVLVADTGIGIAEKDLPYIWNRFWRADVVRSRNAGGTGLGLAIARATARHRAELDVESSPEEGSSLNFASGPPTSLAPNRARYMICRPARMVCHSGAKMKLHRNIFLLRLPTLLLIGAILGRAQPQPLNDRDVSLKKLIPNILADQKSMWSFPGRVAKGKDLIPTAAFAVIGTALVVGADPPEAHYFRNTTAFDGYNRALPGAATSAVILATPLALYGAGLIRKDSKMTTTALLAGEAVADAEIVTAVFKPSVSRWRPKSLPANGNFADTFAEGGNRFSSAHNSFPSGHAMTAFAVATVVSRRYGRQHRWVPVLAYAGAAAIAFSRLTLSAHFTSDVFVGAALGYSISRFAVLRN